MMTFGALEQQLLSFPGAYLDFPFGPEAAVFKVADKMFALVAWQEKPLAISLKCDPEDAIQFRAIFATTVRPGYHLNKRHWNTVTLDETIPGAVPAELVGDMIAASYALVSKGLRKADREKLTTAT